jgi:hypothetical protein
MGDSKNDWNNIARYILQLKKENLRRPEYQYKGI